MEVHCQEKTAPLASNDFHFGQNDNNVKYEARGEDGSVPAVLVQIKPYTYSKGEKT